MGAEPVPQSTKELVLSELAQALGQEVIATVEPSEDIKPPTHTFTPCCITQRPLPVTLREAPDAIVVGLDGSCPRWTPGSVINWTTWPAGFRTPEDAKYATDQCKFACDQWNSYEVGVTFKWVPESKDATFALAYGGDGPSDSTLASAFFPTTKDLSYLLIYAPCFADQWWHVNMWRVLTHELGHILGLRHEFALDLRLNQETGRWETKEKNEAVRLGPKDELSVMNYRGQIPPAIRDSDIMYTREFYSKKGENGVRPTVGHLTIYDYKPM